MNKDKNYYDCLTKVIASFVSALPDSQRRSALAAALRMCAADERLRAAKDGTSLVFPVLAIPPDADISSTINLISGMGATVLAVGQAKPSSTAREIMEIADTMMGRSDIAFSGDPNGIGMPVAATIAAAASADPDILVEAESSGLNHMIAELSNAYNCIAHQGPLAMVTCPDYHTPLQGGLFDNIRNIFSSSDDDDEERAQRRADKKVDKLNQKDQKLEAKQEELRAQIAVLEAQLASTSDTKTKKKLRKKIARLQRKLNRKESKQDKIQDQLAQWSDLADESSDADPVVDPASIEDEDGIRRRGTGLLDTDAGQNVNAMADSLVAAGIDRGLANMVAGYLVSNGVTDGVGYLSRLSTKLGISLPEAAQYVSYVASGLSHSQALDLVHGKGAASSDVMSMIEEAQSRNDAYRLALQNQMSRLKEVNDSAIIATRLYVRTEWADAIMASSDDVADILARVSPDASSTASFLSSLVSLISSARLSDTSASSLLEAVHAAVAGGSMNPEAAYLFTGDPTFIPALVVAVTPPSSAESDAVTEGTGAETADAVVEGQDPNPAIRAALDYLS